MINYLEVPDFHFAPEWSDISEKCAESVRKAAIDNAVDFIALPGDLFDKPLFATDQSKYDIIQKIVKSWLDICPVVAIEGTPSHDAPGCYGPLQKMGLILLKPMKTYGLYTGLKYPFIMEVMNDPDMAQPKCILFGIPELRKDTIQSKIQLSAEEANAAAVTLVGNYINEYVGPMRLKYSDVPAIGLLHGVVSERSKEHSTDIIIRASDIVITTDILENANLDRWSLGHQHIPEEFGKICAGYAGYPGIDRNPWGKRNFIPGFNLIEITDESSPRVHDIIRFPYGTPMRVKIEPGMPIPDPYYPDKAYWLETEDPDAILPEGLHPWSRISYIENITETRRVSKEAADKAKSLWDFFLLVDPEVRPELKEKVDSIPIPQNRITENKLDARLTYVQITGCDLFGGKTVEFDLNDLANGMNQIVGTNGNGDGKSSLLGMCSLYPCVVGKDTKSGRRSALKDFFSGQDSSIKKSAIVNGQHHGHLITIKGVHTQNPKTECYLTIDGVPQLEKATFDAMMEKCEELYGNYEDYLLTTFYEQPQQSRNQRSGLMTATMTGARDLVQNIAGIDREQEKRYSLDLIASYGEDEQQLNSDIVALQEYAEDPEELNLEFANKGSAIVSYNNDLNKVKTEGTEAKVKVESLQQKYTENEKAKTEQSGKQEDIVRLGTDIGNSKRRILESHAVAADLKVNQDTIKKDNEAKKMEQDYSNLLIEYNSIIGEYDKDVLKQNDFKKDTVHLIDNNLTRINTIKKEESDKLDLEFSEAMNKYNLTMQKYNSACIDQNNLKRELQSIIDNAEIKKRSDNKEIELISKPCPECGYIDPDIQENVDGLNRNIAVLDDLIKENFEAIDKLKPIQKPTVIEPVRSTFETNDDIKVLEKAIISFQKEIDSLPEFIKPKVVTPIRPPASLTEFEREAIEDAVDSGFKAETAIEELEKKSKEDYSLLDQCKKDLQNIIIDHEIDFLLPAAEENLSTIRQQHTNIKSTLSTLEAEKKAISDRLEKAESRQKKLLEKKELLSKTISIKIDWTYIAKMLNPDKIPALELDIILDSIDAEATRNIEPFLEGRYSFKTLTRDHTKKKIVDRFDVMIHDAETGKSFSMFYTNPGNKAFYSDCYIKALIRKRNERQMKSYSPIIYDEADGPVNPIRVKAYYDIQQAYFKTEKVLIVSQKDISASYVEKVFNIEEMKS